ncbi:MAG: FG-GAP-like repeat-containing protein [Gammaproteobacteria bacterium]|nr:FG-GAP-like repeat-containing protein [Gammaproteobacteria bacterium]
MGSSSNDTIDDTGDDNNIVVDTPPNTDLSLTLVAPSSITYGVAATITSHVENAQGNIFFTLNTSPAGMQIDSDTGVITWTPSGIHFGGNTRYSFSVSATDDLGSITETASVSVSGNNNQPIVRSSARVPTKEKAIHIGDFDGAAGNEVLVTDNISLIYTLKWDPDLGDSGDFYQEWVYPFSLGNQAHIDAIDTVDVNNDGRLDIIVLNGNTVSVIDGITRTLAYSYEIPDALNGYAIDAANIDNNVSNGIEIVTLVSKGTDQEQLNIFRLPTDENNHGLVNAWTSSVNNYGTDMLLANVDFADTQLEIITNKAFVFDGVSLTDQWTGAKPDNGFGTKIVAADLLGENIKFIIGLFSESGDGRLEVYSPQHNSDIFGALDVVWGTDETETNRCSITVADIDGNGTEELIAGYCTTTASDNGDRISIMTAESQAAFQSNTWTHAATELFYDERRHGGIKSLSVGDIDNDGIPDVIWGNKYADTKYNMLTVANVNQETLRISGLKSQNITLGLFDDAFSGAVNFNLSPTVKYASFISNINPSEMETADADIGNIESRFSFIDYDSGRVQISSQINTYNTKLPVRKLLSYDVFNSGYDQLLFNSAYLDEASNEYSTYQLTDYAGNINTDTNLNRHGGLIPTYNYYEAGVAAGGLNSNFDIADLDGDSQGEIVGFIDNYLFYFDLNPYFEEQWQSIVIEGNGIDVKLIDLDNDDAYDLVHLTDSALYIRKRDTDEYHSASSFFDTVFLLDSKFEGNGFNALQVADLNNDNQMEIIVSSIDNNTSNTSTVYLLDNNAKKIGQITVNGIVTDLQLGQSGNSILAAWKTEADDDGHIDTSYISEFSISNDLQSGMEIMRSPALLGAVSANSMNYGLDNRLLIGTEFGMYINQQNSHDE